MKKTLGIIPMMIVFLSLLICVSLGNETQGVENGQRYERLVIQNVLLIDGKGTPMRGPVDIILQGNRIQSIRPAHRGENVYAEESHILDGTGLYVLPGLINIHAHIHDNRGGIPIPFAYLYKLWLASGITTVRDVGSNYEKTIEERQKSQEGVIAAPRIFLYMSAGGRTPDEVRHSVQRIKARGSDGVKIFGMDRDIMKAALEEAHRLGLRVAHHVGVEETDAWDDASFGVTSIEHWFKECLHPVLEKYFEPNPAHHGSYFWNWTTTDETFWRENYKIWMKAVRQFADMGELVGCGEDAGYIYMLYGFSLIRELELHQEAGFHPIDVIHNATGNNARILGMEDRLGRIRQGFLADIILVDGNPLKNLKYLYPAGIEEMNKGKMVRKGGVLWTIKDGFVYHAPTMLEDVKNIVKEARSTE